MHSEDEPAIAQLGSNVLVMGLSSMVATFGNTLWFYFLPIYYSETYNATPMEISAIYAVWLATAALGSAPAGLLADAYGRKNMIVASSLISAAAVFLFAASNSLLLAAIALPISGLGSSFFRVANTLVAESAEKSKRGQAFGTYSMLSNVAAAFSPLLGGVTISNRGYLLLFVVGGCLTLIAALARILYLKETLPASRRSAISGHSFFSSFAGIRQMMNNRTLSILILVYSMYNILADQNSFITPLYARHVLGFDPITLGILFSALLAAVALSRVPFGRLSDSIGRKKTVVISWIGEISIVYVFVFAPRTMPEVAVIGIAFWMLFGVMDAPAVNAWVAEASDPKSRGQSMGIFYSVTLLPTIPALLLSGYLFSIVPQLPFYANSALGIIALVVLMALT
ncbi:MAG: MFS transporter [Nitrososphaerota archaeon]|nr:MFS transporter [Nitrososphaerota archaeon]